MHPHGAYCFTHIKIVLFVYFTHPPQNVHWVLKSAEGQNHKQYYYIVYHHLVWNIFIWNNCNYWWYFFFYWEVKLWNLKVNSRDRLPVIKFLAKCPQDSIFFNRASLPFTFCKQHLNESFILCACVRACMHVCTRACKLYTTTFGQCRLSDCSKAMKFTPFCHPSHWLLPCPPSCVKNSPQQTIPEQTISNCLLTCPPPQTNTPSPLLAVSTFCLYTCQCVGVGVVCRKYNIISLSLFFFVV